MASKTAILAVKVVADAKEFSKGMDDASSKMGKFQSAAAKLQGPSKVVLAGLGALGAGTAKLASESEQNFGAVDAVFKGYSKQVDALAANSSSKLGVSASDYAKYSALIGSQLKNAGIPMDQLVEKSDGLISMGADFAAQFGGTVPEAVEAMSSALKGEMDPIEKYGVSLSQAKIAAEMAAQGTDKLTGAAFDSAKATAIMSLIQKQGADSMGAFGREAGTAAGQTAIMQAKMADAGAKLGTALLPALTAGAGLLAEVADWVSQNTDKVGILVGVLAGLALAVVGVNAAFKVYQATMVAVSVAQAAFGASKAIVTGTQNLISGFNSSAAAASSFTGKLGTVGGAVKASLVWVGQSTKALAMNTAAMVRNGAVAVAMGIKAAAIAVATGAATAAQWLWNAAMTANPIGLVIAAVALLVAGIVWWITQTKSGQKAWATMTKFLSQAIAAVTKYFALAWKGAQMVFSSIVKGVQGLWKSGMALVQAVSKVAIAVVVAYVKSVQTTANSVVNAVKGFFSRGFNAVRSTVLSIIAGVKSTISGLRATASSVTASVRGFFQSAFNAVRGVVAGVIGSIRTTIGNIRGTVNTVAGVVRNAFAGAFQRLRSVASPIIDGIRGAIDGVSGAVRNAIGWVRDLVSGFKMPGWLSGVLGKGGTGFDITGTFGTIPMAATAGIGATGGLSSATMFSSGNEPRRTNRDAERRAAGTIVNQTIHAAPGMTSEQIGRSAARELMFRMDYR